ncbi:MAG: addiction module protein [bacterium]|nr:addiction module protein [bacterium]
MDLQQTLSELTSLPIKDRLRIVESLWNSIDAEAPVFISKEQREELQRRIERHEKDPCELLTWEQVLDGLRDRR